MTRAVTSTSPDSIAPAATRSDAARISPFQFTSNPVLSWLAGPYGDILTKLRTEVVGGAGALVLTGEVGTGKTMIANTVAAFLLPHGVAIGRVEYPSDDPDDFCQSVGEAFGWQDVRNETFFPRAEEFLGETHLREGRALLVVEEAQRLGRHVFAHIARLVTRSRRIGGDRGSPLTVLLVGQDDLTAVLDAPENATMKSVVQASYRLRPLTEDEVQEYIQHQLIIANAPRDLFTPPALKRVADISRGIPRVINTLCHRAVIEAARQGVRNIGPKLVQASDDALIPLRGTGVVHPAAAPSTTVTAPSARSRTRKTHWVKLAAVAGGLVLVTLSVGYAVHQVRREAAVARFVAPPTPPPTPSTQTPVTTPSSTEAPPPRLETSASAPVTVAPTAPVEAPRPAPTAPVQVTTPMVPVEAPRATPPAPAHVITPPATQQRAVVRPPAPTPIAPPPAAVRARPEPTRQAPTTAGRKPEPDPMNVIDWLFRDAPRSADWAPSQ